MRLQQKLVPTGSFQWVVKKITEMNWHFVITLLGSLLNYANGTLFFQVNFPIIDMYSIF